MRGYKFKYAIFYRNTPSKLSHYSKIDVRNVEE